jgi:hypothetical protein
MAPNITMILNDEFEINVGGAITACFEVLFQHLSEENHEKLLSD